mgnify:FL=1
MNARLTLRSFLMVLIMAMFLTAGGLAQRIDVPTEDIVEPVIPTASGISVHQVSFSFDAGRAANTDWGQIQIDPRRWGNATGRHEGFVQVVLYPAGPSAPLRNEPVWAVRNLYLPRESVKPCPEDPDRGRDPTGVPVSTPPNDPKQVFLALPAAPLCRYFDLVPDREGQGRLTAISAAILVSAQPLPEMAEILRVLSQYPPQTVRVEEVFINAEGADSEDSPRLSTFRFGYDLVGPPPQPLTPEPGPAIPDDLAFPIQVFQADQPNIQCARNQCIPMAHALVFAYLQDRYNNLPMVWDLAHNYAPGIGRQDAAGDVPFWVPEPQTSLVANFDTLSRRPGVLSSSTGDGTSGCNLWRGLISYIATEGELARVVLRHEGGSSTYGDEAACDNGTWILGGITSTREGSNPTWEWIFEQLQLGRGVSMLFGRYNPVGERTSGHMVRIWGAMRFNGKDYLYTMDDGNQGANSSGLRTQQWEVADIGQPGLAGLPDGRLNMDGLSWEIERAVSVQAKPSLVIP